MPPPLFTLSFADMFNKSALKLLDELLELSNGWFGGFGDGACELDCFEKLGDDDDDIDEVLVLLLVIDFFFVEPPFWVDCFGSFVLVEAMPPDGWK